MLSAVCTWHAIVTRLVYDRQYADRIENIVLTILSILYIIYNIGFIFIIYLFVSILLNFMLYIKHIDLFCNGSKSQSNLSYW